MEKLKQQVLACLPKGKVTHKKMIRAFEKVEAVMKKKRQTLDDLATYLCKTKCTDFERMDVFFKSVHQIIREEATKSTYFKENLITIAVNNFLQNSGIYHGSALYGRAYNKTLDFYDPNKRQEKNEGIFNWNGFWSLINTKKGVITGCYLGDSMDVELFYEALLK
ncbi:MAG: hypothetical protein ACRBFS_07885 [Aureispira sp.]